MGSSVPNFPSANEELIEDVLRKIAADQNNGYYDPKERRSGVVFTLHMVRKELEKRGHGRTYAEINLSLEIMSSAVIQTTTADGKEGEFTSKSLYLNNLFRVSKGKLAEDPAAKWFVDFHPFASRALDELTYRQFDYARLMSHKSQLARWLNKVLSLKYLNASFLYPFEIRLSTIMRAAAAGQQARQAHNSRPTRQDYGRNLHPDPIPRIRSRSEGGQQASVPRRGQLAACG